jgi:hypothetical protein
MRAPGYSSMLVQNAVYFKVAEEGTETILKNLFLVYWRWRAPNAWNQLQLPILRKKYPISPDEARKLLIGLNLCIDRGQATSEATNRISGLALDLRKQNYIVRHSAAIIDYFIANG